MTRLLHWLSLFASALLRDSGVVILGLIHVKHVCISSSIFNENKQIRSDNDASELDILGHLGTFYTFLGNSEDF